MKSFSPKPWFSPQPVLSAAYNKEGVANAMNAAGAFMVAEWEIAQTT